MIFSEKWRDENFDGKEEFEKLSSQAAATF